MTKPRKPVETNGLVDQYSELFKDIFREVRSFEVFKLLLLGLTAEIPRKSLPAISKVVGLKNAQSLHHFLRDSPWYSKDLERRRLKILLSTLQDREITLIIDETGDRKKGNTTDYVARQYIGSIGKIENGIVSVNAYGLIGNTTFPLLFRVYKPRSRLKEDDAFKTKTQLASEMVREIVNFGFKIELVVADSVYGESPRFIETLEERKLEYVVAIRQNHSVWLPVGSKVWNTEWSKFNRIFSDGSDEKRFIREVIFGRRHATTFWEITTDTETMPENETWFVQTNITGDVEQHVGNKYGLINWIEYGFKQSKSELGWADFRLTDYNDIEKWWNIVCCAYMMISLQGREFIVEHDQEVRDESPISQYVQWRDNASWKKVLNHFRILSFPLIAYNLLHHWFEIVRFPCFDGGFQALIEIMNDVVGNVPLV